MAKIRWPVMLRRTHEQEYVRQADRWKEVVERERRNYRELDQRFQKAVSFAREFATVEPPVQDHFRDRFIIPTVISSHWIERANTLPDYGDLVRMVMRNVEGQLLDMIRTGSIRDYRGDMREHF